MQYEYCPNNPERFATNLRRDSSTGNLMWDNARGQEVLIVQTPYGQRPAERMPELCAALALAERPVGAFRELRPGVWARFLTAADKARDKGCPLNGEASSYTVLACDVQGDRCRIYAPPAAAMISATCDIPVEMRVGVAAQTKPRGRLWNRQEGPTGYYILEFPAGPGAGYTDGDLVCEIGRLQIPVTRGMLEQRTVYVKSDIRPVLLSRNQGLKLV